MKIHFVCSGNVFRSRLAEAYLKSKNFSGVEVTSSGIRADKNLNGEICFYTLEVAEKYEIKDFLASDWLATTKVVLEEQDYVVFTAKNHQEYCLDELKANIKQFQTWDIEDIPDDMLISGHHDKVVALAEEKFLQIKEKTDKLITDLGL